MNRDEIIKRLKRWPTWLAAIGQISAMLLIAGIDPDQVEMWRALAIGLGEVLTIFGVLNNPTTPDKF